MSKKHPVLSTFGPQSPAPALFFQISEWGKKEAWINILSSWVLVDFKKRELFWNNDDDDLKPEDPSFNLTDIMQKER